MFEDTQEYSNFATNVLGQAYGGFNPAQSDFVRRSREMQNQDRLRQQLMQDDPRAQFLAAIHQHNMGLGPDNARQTRHRQLAGALINSRLGAGIMGGSRLDMYQGIHMGVSNTGMINMLTNGGTQRIYGDGSLGRQHSKAMLETMEKHYFNPTGGSVGHRTHGLNRKDFGEMMGALGMRGGLSGIRGTYKAGYGEGADAMPASIEMAEAEAKKLKDLTDAGAEAVGKMKDILGDIGANKLIQALEGLQGGTVNTVQSFKSASRRLDQLKTIARTGGGSEEAWLDLHKQASMALETQGASRSGAAAGAMTVAQRMAGMRQTGLSYRRAVAETGGYAADLSGEVVDRLVRDQTMLSQENPEVAAMLFAIQESELDPEFKTAFRNELAEANQGTEAERRTNLARLEAKVSRATGMSVSAAMGITGGDVERFLTAESSTALAGMSQTLADERLLDLQLPAALQKLTGQDLTAEETAQARRLFTTHSDLTLQKMVELGGADADMARRILLVKKTNAELQTYETTEAKGLREEAEYKSDLARAMFGGDRSRSGIVDSLLGGGSVSEIQALEALYEKDKDSTDRTDITNMGQQQRQDLFRSLREKGKRFAIQDREGRTYVHSAAEEVVTAEQDALEKARQLRMYKAFGVTLEENPDGTLPELSDPQTQAMSESMKDAVEGTRNGWFGKRGDFARLDEMITTSKGNGVLQSQLRRSITSELADEKNDTRREALQERLDKLDTDASSFSLLDQAKTIIDLLVKLVHK